MHVNVRACTCVCVCVCVCVCDWYGSGADDLRIFYKLFANHRDSLTLHSWRRYNVLSSFEVYAGVKWITTNDW